MAMVGVANDSLQADSRPKSTGLVWVSAANWRLLHSSVEPSELSKWLSHDDSTINIVLSIIIINIFLNPGTQFPGWVKKLSTKKQCWNSF